MLSKVLLYRIVIICLNSLAAPVSMVSSLMAQSLPVKMPVKVCSNLSGYCVITSVVTHRCVSQHVTVDTRGQG